VLEKISCGKKDDIGSKLRRRRGFETTTKIW
jgi:hypothetical protein